MGLGGYFTEHFTRCDKTYFFLVYLYRYIPRWNRKQPHGQTPSCVSLSPCSRIRLRPAQDTELTWTSMSVLNCCVRRHRTSWISIGLYGGQRKLLKCCSICIFHCVKFTISSLINKIYDLPYYRAWKLNSKTRIDGPHCWVDPITMKAIHTGNN